ncbi:hypothetical protein DFQ01_14527 [Paenibacillus cellulosilyticus]|uniref:Uncharacterized protein n=1 Tax=Paenibacillus cellulosilyticus TaxID=375489 RepID=A0A2V2YC83_9BACL|nr:hypothetical protein [Paenibacillus cellulosilyticus]PWV89430.1 hypothetical protein DFQ01_14527 [Paenibacillus cellulosilyticus]QKS47280.1 hypothetical protein HUB94_22890 [Paenibacillus cellulosilyticus]
MKASWRRIAGSTIALMVLLPALPAAAHDHGQVAADGTGLSTLTINTAIGSIVFVLLAITAYLLHARSLDKQLSPMAGMMASMTVAMAASLTIGTTAGILLSQMFISTVISVVFGMAVGYLAGQGSSMLAAMDGMLSGLMGGMMGAMLGVMVVGEYPTLSILFMDLVFVGCMSALYRFLELHSARREHEAETEHSIHPSSL